MTGLGDARREALATELEGHMSDRDFEQGCAMLCGYDGDDRALHLAEALAPLVAGWLGEERAAISKRLGEMAGEPLDSRLDRTTWRGALLAAASVARGDA